MAKLSDQRELKPYYKIDGIPQLQGTQFHDIDVTIDFKSTKENKEINSWWAPVTYDYDSVSMISNNEWLENLIFPDASHTIQINNPNNGKRYYVLSLMQDWTNRTQESKEYRLLWMILRSFLVKNEEFEKLWSWLKHQDLGGRWIPEGPEIYNKTFGDYPWALQFQEEGLDNCWKTCPEIEIPILPTSNRLVFESGYNCSVDDTIYIEVPSPEFFKFLDLKWNGIDSFNYQDHDSGFICPSICEEGPTGLIVEKTLFDEFLTQNNLRIIWTALYQAFPVPNDRENSLFREYSRVYTVQNERILKSKGIESRYSTFSKGKITTKKTSLKKTSIKKSSVKKSGVKKFSAKKSGAKKFSAKKSGVKKSSTKKLSTKKLSTKKLSVKKS